MRHSRGLFLETTKKNTKQQVVEYNSQQWSYFSELMVEVFKGSYGEHFDFLLSELREGPYWHLVKARLTQPQDYDPSKSVSGSRSPQPEDNSPISSSSEEWEYASDLLTEN